MENKEDKKEVVDKKEPVKMRQVIIETDGDNIKLVKAEVSGRIELVGILENIIGYINNQAKK